MLANGYLDTRPRHPFALAAAIAINLAAVGAMLAYTTDIMPRDPEGIPLIKIPVPPIIVKPVEQPKTRQTKQVDPQPQPRPIPLDPMIKIDPINGGQTLWPELPRQPDPIPGGDTIKPEPKPVEIAAQIDPRFRSALQPPYPPALERADIQGTVTVRVQVGTDGRVTAVELVSADDPGFFTATREQALRYWRFRPATRDGTPVVSWLTKTVRFTIRRG